ncbi:hypothetical protein IIM_05029 [Bacillus cereus VD107]|nr:hypothetical protein IIM_05029 [Bacillus cereus VD107]
MVQIKLDVKTVKGQELKLGDVLSVDGLLDRNAYWSSRFNRRETPVKTRFKNTNDCWYRSSGDFSNSSHSISSSDNNQGIYMTP